jgi:hypothetical protein
MKFLVSLYAILNATLKDCSSGTSIFSVNSMSLDPPNPAPGDRVAFFLDYSVPTPYQRLIPVQNLTFSIWDQATYVESALSNATYLMGLGGVRVTRAILTGGIGYEWNVTAEKVVDEEFAPQLQDLVTMYCKRNWKSAAQNKFPARPTMGRIRIEHYESDGDDGAQ